MVMIVNYVRLCKGIVPPKFGGQIPAIATVRWHGAVVGCVSLFARESTVTPDHRKVAIGRIWPPNLEAVIPSHRQTDRTIIPMVGEACGDRHIGGFSDVTSRLALLRKRCNFSIVEKLSYRLTCTRGRV
jgi:hypothetical protein